LQSQAGGPSDPAKKKRWRLVIKSVSLRVPHSILFVWDLQNENASVPEYQDNTLISYNEGCVSVGTRLETDGETTISFVERPSAAATAVFRGSLQTPSGSLSISTSSDDGILSIGVDRPTTTISIFANDMLFPSRIDVLIDG